MLAYAALGLVTFSLLYLVLRGFVAMPAHDLARAAKTFLAVFGTLASTGLLLTGRMGLAIITVSAVVMAVRSLARGSRGGGADPLGQGRTGPASSVETRLLVMRLDHATGEVEGRVRAGAFAGRELAALGVSELLALLDEARLEDPQSVPLLEAYLDRRTPDWRGRRAGAAGSSDAPPPPQPPAGAAVMDERTALEILGLTAGASEEAIRAAHRSLMARLHPDHGGSSYLATEINRARDFLLRRRH